MHGLELIAHAAANVWSLLADLQAQGIAVWVVAGTLLWSGTVKMLRPAVATAGVVRFGLLKRGSPAVGRGIGIAELCLAMFLIAGVVPLFALATATAVFATFAWLIGAQLRAGDTRPCYCFGSDAPLTRTALVRAAVVAGLAFVLATTAPVLGSLPSGTEIARNAVGALAVNMIRPASIASTAVLRKGRSST